MITNALNKDVNNKLAVPFLNLTQVLEKHCGPNASFACLANEGGVGMEFSFTKDGISIIKALKVRPYTPEYMVHSMVAYIGQRVDNACHDGTTTSMMYFSRVAHSLLTDDKVQELIQSNTRLAQKSFITAINHTLNYLKECSLKTQAVVNKKYKEKQKRYWIAYHQAMISSKGNVELSEAVANMVSKIPVEKLFQIIDIRNEAFENPVTSIKAEELKGINIQFKGFINSNLYNTDLKTKYVGKNVEVWVTEDGIVERMPCFDILKDFVDLHITTKKRKDSVKEGESLFEDIIPPTPPSHDIIVAAPKVSPTVLMMAEEYNSYMSSVGSPYRLVIVQHQNFTNQRSHNWFRALAVVSDHPETTEGNLNFVKIKDVTLIVDSRGVTFSNLYKKKTSSIYHPLYTKKSNPHYTKFTDELEKLIKNTLNSFDENSLTKNDLSDMIMLYRQLICTSHVWIMIKGTTQDLLTLKSEAMDAVGAAISAVSEGYVFGGFERIIAVPHTGDPKVDLFLDILSAEAKMVKKTVSKSQLDVASFSSDVINHIAVKLDGTEVNVKQSNLFDQEVILIQPIVGFKALLDRMIEMLPRLMATSIFIGDLETPHAFS